MKEQVNFFMCLTMVLLIILLSVLIYYQYSHLTKDSKKKKKKKKYNSPNSNPYPKPIVSPPSTTMSPPSPTMSPPSPTMSPPSPTVSPPSGTVGPPSGTVSPPSSDTPPTVQETIECLKACSLVSDTELEKIAEEGVYNCVTSNGCVDLDADFVDPVKLVNCFIGRKAPCTQYLNTTPATICALGCNDDADCILDCVQEHGNFANEDAVDIECGKKCILDLDLF